MNLKRKYSIYRKMAFVMSWVILFEAFVPSLAIAITNGSIAPEFSSYQSAGTSSMVDEFSGDFSYNIPILNIPGANGGGYSCGLSYASGSNVESEASWVGLGWTLNPGVINRHKKGFADDINGEPVTYYNKVAPNRTVTVGVSAGEIEAFSFDANINVNANLRYNNYKGFGYTVGAGITTGRGTIGYTKSDGVGSFSVEPSVGNNLSGLGKLAAKALVQIGTQYGLHRMGDDARLVPGTEYEGKSYNVTLSGNIIPFPFPVGAEQSTNGTYSVQKNKNGGVNTLSSYGYMYSYEGHDKRYSMMDYNSANSGSYNKRDRYLSAPFSNADMFIMSGEGVGGAFRLHNNNVGTFYPNETTSKTKIRQLSGSVDLGWTFGVGAELGVGKQELTVRRNFSKGNGNSNDYNFETRRASKDFTPSKEGVFFRFMNDLGGGVNYGGHTGAESASVNGKQPNINASFNTSLTDVVEENGQVRSGRSNYIAYHTNKEMVGPDGKPTAYAYEKSVSTNKFLDRMSVPDGIGEIVSYNESGSRYVYGLPVYARNESNISYDLRGTSASSIKERLLAYKDISNPFSKVGEANNALYATSFLLTEVTSPDYVDKTLNGPSEDDLGGYTKFEYKQAYGSRNGQNWYNWRVPYTGLLYSPQSLTDNLDDMGSVSFGEREVYYVQKIETKSHVAVFVTNKTKNYSLGSYNISGSGDVRQDGFDAADNNAAAMSPNVQGTNDVEMLERIELYAKPVDGSGAYHLLKTTHFEYDYSLCPLVPNNAGAQVIKNRTDANGVSSNVDINKNKGKLTLKKIWFEYENIVNARISPYQFSYAYPSASELNTRNGIPSTYESIVNYGRNLNASQQNPAYDPQSLDRWGAYRAEGALRNRQLNKWVDQTPVPFDPAAWQLKQISLPSGGKVLVQYEQKEYATVQDRDALAMVSLKSYNSAQNRFYLNVEDDLGVSSQADLNLLKNKIRRTFSEQKIYFKMLYALKGENPNLGNCTSDYVSGYVNLKNVGVDANGLYVDLGTGSSNKYELPRDVCKDYLQREVGGKLDGKAGCGPGAGVPDNTKAISVVRQLLNFLQVNILPITSCLKMEESLSYLRIPTLDGKKGGGIRVKRVLMHDKGIEAGDEALYGTEYFYTHTNGKSSGVATNEPSVGREENALITFLPKRSAQRFLSKAIGGTDIEQFEGPLGEYLLPSASVGYERVVAKSIHSEKRTNTGFVENVFYTAKQYPFDMNYNTDDVKGKGVENTAISQDKNWKLIPIPSFPVQINNLWLSQGYRFIKNNMHGQLRSISTYAGEFDAAGKPSPTMLTSQQEFKFFEPGESVPMKASDESPIKMAQPGKEEEIVMERKAIKDESVDGKIEADLEFSYIPLFFFPVYVTAAPSLGFSQAKLETHVTTKIVSYPAILKSVTSYQDGIYHQTENLAFNPTNGQAVMTKTSDGYNKLNLQASLNHDGSYITRDIPASTQYKEVGQKAASEGLLIHSKQSLFMNFIDDDGYALDFISSTGESVCEAMNTFTRGDLVKLITQQGSDIGYFHVDEPLGNRLNLLPSALNNKAGITMDNPSAVSVEIVRSGKTNDLESSVGGYTTYGKEQALKNTPIPANILAPRKALATKMTQMLASNGTYTLTPSDLSNFQLVDPVDGCGVENKDNITVTVTDDEIKINYEESNDEPKVIENHPMVAYLNRLMDQFWLSEIDPNLPKRRRITSPCPSACYEYTYPDVLAGGEIEQDMMNYTKSFGGITYKGKNDSNLELKMLIHATSGVATFANSYIPYRNEASLTDIRVYLGGQRIFETFLNLRNSRTTCTMQTVLRSRLNIPGNTYNTLFKRYSDSDSYPLKDFFIKSDGSKADYTKTVCFFGQDESGYLTYNFRDPVAGTYQTYSIPDLRFYGIDNTINIKCSTTIKRGGSTFFSSRKPDSFRISEETGELYYYAPNNECNPQEVTCIDFCPDVNASTTIDNVVSANAVTYAPNWSFQTDDIVSDANAYEKGLKGRWRMRDAYVYNTDVIGGSNELTATERNYNNAGTYSLEKFNWKHLTSNKPENWINSSTIDKYSAQGEALEKSNAIGIKTTAKYGYADRLPYLMAKNSDNASVQFESFENVYAGNKLENNRDVEAGKVVPTTAHSGKSSFLLGNSATNTSGSFSFSPIPVTSQILDQGLSCKLWVKNSAKESTLNPFKLSVQEQAGTALSYSQTIKKVAQTGEWSLYEVKIKLDASKEYSPIVVTLKSVSTGAPVWIDDLRIQPIDAQAIAYVYDNISMRLLAMFDDQHFGLYYKYNAEGKLLRKQIETEKGMRTVQEVQTHTPLQNR